MLVRCCWLTCTRPPAWSVPCSADLLLPGLGLLGGLRLILAGLTLLLGRLLFLRRRRLLRGLRLLFAGLLLVLGGLLLVLSGLLRGLGLLRARLALHALGGLRFRLLGAIGCRLLLWVLAACPRQDHVDWRQGSSCLPPPVLCPCRPGLRLPIVAAPATAMAAAALINRFLIIITPLARRSVSAAAKRWA